MTRVKPTFSLSLPMSSTRRWFELCHISIYFKHFQTVFPKKFEHQPARNIRNPILKCQGASHSMLPAAFAPAQRKMQLGLHEWLITLTDFNGEFRKNTSSVSSGSGGLPSNFATSSPLQSFWEAKMPKPLAPNFRDLIELVMASAI